MAGARAVGELEKASDSSPLPLKASSSSAPKRQGQGAAMPAGRLRMPEPTRFFASDAANHMAFIGFQWLFNGVKAIARRQVDSGRVHAATPTGAARAEAAARTVAQRRRREGKVKAQGQQQEDVPLAHGAWPRHALQGLAGLRSLASSFASGPRPLCAGAIGCVQVVSVTRGLPGAPHGGSPLQIG